MDGAEGSRTEKKSIHRPCGIALKVTSRFPQYNRNPEYIKGLDCVVKFLDRIEEVQKEAQPILNPKTPIILPSPIRLEQVRFIISLTIHS